MNHVIRRADLSELNAYIDFVQKFPNPEHSTPLAFDAVLKWATIIRNIEEVWKKGPRRILDVGCGTAHTVALINEYFYGTIEEAFLLDLEVPHPSKMIRDMSQAVYLRGDFFKLESQLQSEYFDVVIDSCALTHFDPRHDHAHNDGLARASKIINRVMAEDGIFVCSSDILTTDSDKSGEYVSPASLVADFGTGGLRLRGPLDTVRDGQIVNNNFDYLTIGSFTFEK